MTMIFRRFLAAAALAVVLCAPAFCAEEEPRYIDGEAIVVMRSAVTQEVASVTNTAQQTLPGGGTVIQFFSPVKEKSASGVSLAASADSGRLEVVHLKAPDGTTTEDFIENLRNDPNVVSAMPNYIMKAHSVTPNDARWSEQWGPEAINATELWKRGTGSEDVVVAVIDTGVIYDHGDLADNMYTFDEATAAAILLENPDMFTDEVPLAGSHGAWFHSKIDLPNATPHPGVPVGPSSTMQGDADEANYIDNGTMEQMSRIGDFVGHGTHVAGIIGAVGNNGLGIAGLNWKIKIMVVNVFSQTILGESAEASDIIRGIDFIVAAKNAGVNIRAANISLGGWYASSEMENSAYDYKIRELSDAGIVVCMAAGNDGQDIDNPTGDIALGQRFYPAAFKYENTISVGALIQNADGTLAPDTPGNGGIGYSDYSSSGEWVDIFAPGTYILSTARTQSIFANQLHDTSGYVEASGTSMAAPHVTGAAALLAALIPEKSATEIKEMILEGADGTVAHEGYSRYGALDVYKAWKHVTYAEEVVPVNPEDAPEADSTESVALLASLISDESEAAAIFGEGTLISIDGLLYLDTAIVNSAVENISAGREPSGISLFPVFSAESTELAENDLGAIAFIISGEVFGDGASLSDIAVYKLKPDGSALEYKEAGNSAADGKFRIAESDSSRFGGRFYAEKEYIITLFIADNGAYDLNNTAETITDPTMIVSFFNAATHTKSGGGCSAGFGTGSIAAFAAITAALRTSRNFRSRAR